MPITRWTNEPWQVGFDKEAIVDQHNRFVVGCNQTKAGNPSAADAKRIVNCVNGCAGLTEEEIRAAVSQFKVAKASGSLAGRKQQDAAYRQVVDVLKTILPYLHEEEPVVKKARVALAAAQGEHT